MKRSREMEVNSEIRSAIEELSLMVKIRSDKAGNEEQDDHEASDCIQTQTRQEDAKIPTRPFLSLCTLVLQVLDKIGPTMAVLRQDIHQNIERLETLHETDPSLYSNLAEVLKKEASEGIARKSTSCSRALLWLTRSLDFTVALLKRIGDGRSIEEAVEESYSMALKPWHGWISAAAFKVALKLLPDSQTLIKILNPKGEEKSEPFKEELQILISLFVPFLDVIHSTLKLYNLDRLKAT